MPNKIKHNIMTALEIALMWVVFMVLIVVSILSLARFQFGWTFDWVSNQNVVTTLSNLIVSNTTVANVSNTINTSNASSTSNTSNTSIVVNPLLQDGWYNMAGPVSGGFWL